MVLKSLYFQNSNSNSNSSNREKADENILGAIWEEMDAFMFDKLDEINFEVMARLDTEMDIDYFENGGILPYVLRKILKGNES